MVIDGERLRSAVGAHVAAGTVPGAVLAVAAGGRTYAAAVGEMRGDAVVRLSSMTKPLMAALTLMLAEDGLLSTGDGIERWIPELADRRVLRRPDGALDDTVPAERPITVDDLLTMRMGLGLHFDGPCPVLEEASALGVGVGPPDPACPLTPDEWIARFARLPLMYQPGTEWTYDLAFGVLGVLLARAARRPLDVLLHDRLLRPLGMTDTGFTVPEHARDRLVPCLTPDERGGLVTFDGTDGSRWNTPPAFPDARGGLVSTASDYLRFARMLLDDGRAADGTRLLSPASITAMTTDHLDPPPRSATARALLQGSGWGHGVEVVTPRHGTGARTRRYGWGGGLGTVWYSFPERDAAAVLLTQCIPPPGPLIDAFLSALYRALDA
ncbi:serine hydrolase domain-containing protein [Actinocorallia populi]|uniref:serine hydrolase domain-containing protein n=1 Tax=Actinocorallia populi TaxID=2079200 RepID=UPI000D09644B|nr:serine hydrolase domain-containing protein [Actinocorallia populi]